MVSVVIFRDSSIPKLRLVAVAAMGGVMNLV
jgi:hypothetical protein